MCVLFRWEGTNIYMEETYCQTFFFLITLYLTCLNNMPVLLLLPRFCYCMWKSWGWPSAFFFFLMTSVKSLSKPSALWQIVMTMFPHVPAELSLRLLSGYFGGIKIIRNSLTCSQKQKTHIFFSFPVRHSHVFFLSVAVSCLQLRCHDCHLSLQMYQSRVAFCQLFSAGLCIYKWDVDIYIDLHCAIQVC